MSTVKTRLIECRPWKATFEPVTDSKDTFHCVVIVADTIQNAMLALAEHLPKTDCKLTGVDRMSWVRGVIV